MNQQYDVKNLQNIIETSIEATLSQFDEETINIYLPDSYLDFLNLDYFYNESYSLFQEGNCEALVRLSHYFGLVYNNVQQRIEEYRLLKNLDPYYVNNCVLQIMANYQNEMTQRSQVYSQLGAQYRAGLIDMNTLIKLTQEACK